MGRRKNPDGPSKQVGLRLDPSTHEWYKSLGKSGPDILRAIVEEFRMSKSDRVIDEKIARLKDELTALEAKELEIRKKLRELEGIKVKLVDTQLEYLRVRQRLIERYLKNPDGFVGWITGPANEHFIGEGKFENPREVAEFCRAEVERRRSK